MMWRGEWRRALVHLRSCATSTALRMMRTSGARGEPSFVNLTRQIDKTEGGGDWISATRLSANPMAS
eukprot:scaffold65679_cov66-Phaeocystis_antarctica.AAC.3